MSKDFRASQVETSRIIASGAIASGKPLGLAIYSGSIASNREGGITDGKMFDNVGTDVFLFVSGTTSNADFNRSDVTLFGGDVVISGTIYAERQVIEVDGIVDGDMIVTGSLRVEPDACRQQMLLFLEMLTATETYLLFIHLGRNLSSSMNHQLMLILELNQMMKHTCCLLKLPPIE